MDKNMKLIHTERQIKIYEEIGKLNKPNIDRDIRNNNFSICGYILIGIVISVLVISYLGVQYLVLGILIVASMALMSITMALPKNEKLKEVKDKSDYEIGLLYSKYEKRVVGNSRANKQVAKISTIAFSVMFLLAIGMFLLISSNYEPTTYDNVVEIQGTLKSISIDNDEDIHIKINESETDMIISSIYTYQMNYAELRNDTSVGDSVVVYKERDYTSYDETVYAVVYLKINDTEYLYYDLVIIAEEENNSIGLKTFYWFGGITLAFSILGLITLLVFIPRREAKEVYNLSLTEEETQVKISEINNDIFNETSNKHVHIKTSPTKKMKIPFYIMMVFMMIIAIGMFVMAISELFAIIPGVIAMGIALLMFYASKYIDKTYIELDELTLRYVQMKKVKEINIFDISKIEANQRFTNIYDKSGKLFVQATTKTNNMREIFETLTDYGVRIDVNKF